MDSKEICNKMLDYQFTLLTSYNGKINTVEEDEEKMLWYDNEIKSELKFWKLSEENFAYAQKIPLALIERGHEEVIKVLPKIIKTGKITDTRLKKDKENVVFYFYLKINKLDGIFFKPFPSKEYAQDIIETCYANKWLRVEGEEIEKKSCIIL